MKIDLREATAALVFGLGMCAIISPSHGTEPKLPELTNVTLGGEWQAAWVDRVRGPMVILMRIDGQRGSISVAREIGIQRFEIIQAEATEGGKVEIEATESRNAKAFRFRIRGIGWALEGDGLIDAIAEKLTWNGQIMSSQPVKLYQANPTFLTVASHLIDRCRKEETKGVK